jgi:hypothetical protein
MLIHKVTTWRGDAKTKAGAILCGAPTRANLRQRTLKAEAVTCPECLALMPPPPPPRPPRVPLVIHKIPMWGDGSDLTTLCGAIGDRRRPNKKVTCKECRSMMRRVILNRAKGEEKELAERRLSRQMGRY